MMLVVMVMVMLQSGERTLLFLISYFLYCDFDVHQIERREENCINKKKSTKKTDKKN